MTGQLLELEKQVLEKLLAGEHPVIKNLRAQLAEIEVIKREFTGSGFIASFRVNSSLIDKALLGRDFKFGDVVADIENIKYGAGFVLYITKGAIDALEGYSFEEPWPEQIGTFKLAYTKQGVRDLTGIDEANTNIDKEGQLDNR